MDITAVEQGAQAKFRRENLGFVVQDFNLLDRLTIEENIALPLVLLRLPAEKVHAKSVEIMAVSYKHLDVYKRQEVEKALGDDGRILVRESGTEPVIRVMVEAASNAICEENVDKVIAVMRSENLIVQ